MKNRTAIALVVGLLLIVTFATVAAAQRNEDQNVESWTPAIAGSGLLESSTGSGPFFRSTGQQDTFALYGTASRFPEGRFSSNGDAIPDLQGWSGLDMTDDDFNPWQISSFNSPTGSLAAWCGLDSTDPLTDGWVSTPGYGNNWSAILQFRKTPQNSLVPNSVELSFVYNHSSEPGFDHFYVEYDSNGRWIPVLRISGDNIDGQGNHIPIMESLSLPYSGGDYGVHGDIRIRIGFDSDGAYSDADGAFISLTGGVQIDDLIVTDNSGASPVVYSTDFNDGTFGHWTKSKLEFAGDFFKVFTGFSDLDPCRENSTPVVGFIDNNTPVSNPDAIALYGTDKTGGSISANWSYGIQGGWVVNYQGGLSKGSAPIYNLGVSPPIAYDLPGTADDDPNIQGTWLAMDIYRHLPGANGIFAIVEIASSTDGGLSFEEPINSGYLFYSNASDWFRQTLDISGWITPGATHLQLRIGYRDLNYVFGYYALDATPSPIFDNVSVVKTRIHGPSIETRTIDLFQDSFPNGGGIDASSLAARDLLDIRLDMARDINSGDVFNTAGDSIVADIVPLISGTTLAIGDISLEWVLDRNPLFDDVRSMPAGANTVLGGAADGRDQWTGSVAADSATVASGARVADRYFFDLPDADFFYPGDRLRYHIRAEDSGGNITTLPRNIQAFLSGDGYSRTYTVRGLPTLKDSGASPPTQPSILFINDFGRRGAENEYLQALNQNGLQEGDNVDIYTVQGPSSGVGNGIGSSGSHGANAQQLAGYDCIIYLSGDLSQFTLGVANAGNGGSANEKSRDVEVLTNWHDLSGDRFAAFFGDGLVDDLASTGTPEGLAFLQNILGVNFHDRNVSDDVGGQSAPRVVPEVASFSSSYIAYGGCLRLNQFDHIRPSGNAIRGHAFLYPDSEFKYVDIAASVIHDRTVGTDRKVDITFPYDLQFVRSDDNGSGVVNAMSARAILLEEVFQYFGNPHPISVVTDTENAPLPFERALTAPNPFNPATTIHFTSATRSQHSIRIFDARGRLVRTLLDELRDGGDYQIQWDGRDASGQSLASGAYLIEVIADGNVDMQKGVLLK